MCVYRISIIGVTVILQVNVGWKRNTLICELSISHETYLIFCSDEWLVTHESPNQFVLKM